MRTITTFSAADIIAEFEGRISYRMLDYWCRTGTIQIADNKVGSGNHRRFTQAEINALRDYLEAYEALQDEMAYLRSGRFFASRLAHHRTQHDAA